MIAMTYEDSSGMLDMMEESYMRDAHTGHADPQIQEDIQGI
jgi:hypothetical protein